MPRFVVSLLLVKAFTAPVAAQVGSIPGRQTSVDLHLTDTIVLIHGGQTMAAQRGFLAAPENRSDPHSRTIRIRFVRFRSTAPEPGPPILFLAGGPGASGVASAGDAFFQDLRRVGDVILVDQRGTPGSEPSLRCPERWTVPLDRPGTWADHMASLRSFAAACARHWQAQGVDLTGYNTAESADDFADLGAALGAQKVALYGWSYGTALGLEILKRHPTLVARAALMGVTVEGIYPAAPPAAAHQQLARVDSALRTDSAAAVKVPDLLALLRRTLATLDSQPVTVKVLSRSGDSVATTFGAFDVQRSIAEALNNRRNFAGWLPRALLDASRGDWNRLAPSRSQPANAMRFGVDCSTGVSPDVRTRIDREAPVTLLGRAASFPAAEYCDSIPHRDIGGDLRTLGPSPVPILFINGTMDRNRVERTEEIRSEFPNSVHLIIEGGFHDDFPDEAKRRVLQFLRGERIDLRPIRVPLTFPEVNRW